MFEEITLIGLKFARKRMQVFHLVKRNPIRDNLQLGFFRALYAAIIHFIAINHPLMPSFFSSH